MGLFDRKRGPYGRAGEPSYVPETYTGISPPAEIQGPLRQVVLQGTQGGLSNPLNIPYPAVLFAFPGPAQTLGVGEIEMAASPGQRAPGPSIESVAVPQQFNMLHLWSAGDWTIHLRTSLVDSKLHFVVVPAFSEALVSMLLQGRPRASVQTNFSDIPISTVSTEKIPIENVMRCTAVEVEMAPGGSASLIRARWGNLATTSRGTILSPGRRVVFEGPTLPLAALHARTDTGGAALQANLYYRS